MATSELPSQVCFFLSESASSLMLDSSCLHSALGLTEGHLELCACVQEQC